MRKQGLSRRERNMVEEAVTQVCWAMGVSPRDGELRQTAWAGILSVKSRTEGHSVIQHPGIGCTALGEDLCFLVHHTRIGAFQCPDQFAVRIDIQQALVAQDLQRGMVVIGDL